MLDVEIVPSYPMPSDLWKAILESWYEALVLMDNMLTILDEHYNNVKVLDVLNQELFQLQMADKETVLDRGIYLSRHLQILAVSFPDHFPPDRVVELKRDHFYGRLPWWLKAMLA